MTARRATPPRPRFLDSPVEVASLATELEVLAGQLYPLGSDPDAPSSLDYDRAARLRVWAGELRELIGSDVAPANGYREFTRTSWHDARSKVDGADS